MSNSYNDTGKIIYKCDSCEAGECKLWRIYQNFLDNQKLFCLECGIKHQNKILISIDDYGMMTFDEEKGWKNKYATDQIGYLIPAVPTEENDKYWGYSSVPENLVMWWKNLPNYSKKEVL